MKPALIRSGASAVLTLIALLALLALAGALSGCGGSFEDDTLDSTAALDSKKTIPPMPAPGTGI